MSKQIECTYHYSNFRCRFAKHNYYQLIDEKQHEIKASFQVGILSQIITIGLAQIE